MNIIGIIPARYGSTRFPGKPLVDINGKTMIQRVYEQASQAKKLTQVFVATDNEAICDHVRSFGGNVIMTHTQHKNGTERCAEAVGLIGGDIDAVINIQGDEPFIAPSEIDLVAKVLTKSPQHIATLVKRLHSFTDYLNPNIVKAVLNANMQALFFSRSPVPYIRAVDAEAFFDKGHFYRHIGIYGYPVDVLTKIVALPQSQLELMESLEQLRWLENGYAISVEVTENDSISIDTPEDLEKIVGR